MMFLLSVIIPILTFIFEAYPRFLNRKFGVDIWTHLLYLKEYKRQKKLSFAIKGNFLVEGKYDYPPIFILILSKFPLKLVEKYEFIFSPFFDSLFLIIIFFMSFYLTNNIAISVLTQIIYSLTPIMILENSSATPRSLGYSLFTVLFISLFLFIQNHQIILLFIAIVCGALIFLSHRFTTQGYLFFSLFFTILEKNLIYLEVFILTFILAIIFSKGFYLNVLRGHIGNLIFWQKNIRYRFAHQVKGNYKKHKTEDFIFKLYNQFLKFPPFVLEITNPWAPTAICALFFLDQIDPLMFKLILWVLFSYVLALLTIWIPKLRFLGEGQRYLELSGFPTAFLSSLVFLKLLKTNLWGITLFIYLFLAMVSFAAIIVIQKKGIIKDKLRTVTPGMEKMFNFLRRLKEKPRLLCIPHQITTNTIYHTSCPVFVNADYTNIEKISNVYPYIKMPIEKIMQKHKLDLILLNEEYAKPEELNLNKLKIVKRIDKMLLLKIVK